jgi:hypothetical protein
MLLSRNFFNFLLFCEFIATKKNKFIPPPLFVVDGSEIRDAGWTGFYPGSGITYPTHFKIFIRKCCGSKILSRTWVPIRYGSDHISKKIGRNQEETRVADSDPASKIMRIRIHIPARNNLTYQVG